MIIGCEFVCLQMRNQNKDISCAQFLQQALPFFLPVIIILLTAHTCQYIQSSPHTSFAQYTFSIQLQL